MKRIKLGIFVLISVMLASLALSGIVIANPPFDVADFNKTNKYVQDEIIIKFKGDVKPFRAIKIPKGKVLEEIKKYQKRADVEYAEPNYIAWAFMVPNDPYYGYQWHLSNSEYGGINIVPAWDISTGSGVTVAIVDTGVAYENYGWRYKQAPDLSQTCFVPGYDFVYNDSHPNDDNSHGTHIAGTIAQSTNNSVGVAGVAFNACLMPVKVLNRYGSGTYADVAEGIRFAADNGAKVINLSLGGPYSSKTLEEAVAYAYNKGVTIVAAAGNDGSDNISYPAAYDDYVIAVGATQYNEILAPYSNYGLSLDLVAPGGNNNLDQNNDGYSDGILQNTFNPNTRNTRDFGYWFFQGTSMAAPHVAGVAALLIANGNTTTPDKVRAALEATAKDLGLDGWDSIYGWGIVDAFASLGWKTVCEPTAEVCDGTDNDCDGIIDEDLTRQCGETDIGVCTYGTETCSTGIWIGCTAIFPTTETCNNIDDNCNGLVDEDLTGTFGINTGECSEGTKTCIEGEWEIITPEEGPTEEICDAKDNDCDGSIDEELGQTSCGIGACQVTIDNCVGGIPQICTPGAPTEEICDDIDNDCDGLVDEELDCLPKTEEFIFTGTVPKQGELRHIVAIVSPGAASMYVKLTWNSWNDLRLRVYNPDEDIVAQVDESSWRNKIEEITIKDLEAGDWQVGIFSESRWSSVSYTIKGVVSY